MFFDTATLQNSILGQFILPFIIIFAVAYGSLRTAKVFEDKNVNALIAAVIAFLSATYTPLVNALWIYFPYLTGLLIILFVYNLISTVLFGKKEKAQAGQPHAKEGQIDVVILIGIILVVLGMAGAGALPDLPGLDSTNLLFLFALLAILVIVKRGWGGPGIRPSRPQPE